MQSTRRFRVWVLGFSAPPFSAPGVYPDPVEALSVSSALSFSFFPKNKKSQAPPSSTWDPHLKTCHPEAIRQGWLKDLNVNSGNAASVQAPLCGGHLQVALRPVAGPK
jgi:hypothetical protein